MPPDLAEGYYVENFLHLINSAQERYQDLLSPQEREYCEIFRGLSQDAKRLYVRLISRKGPCFRLDKLNYPEIASISGAAQTLELYGLLDEGAEESTPTLLDLLLKPELEALARPFFKPAALRKPALIEELCAHLEDDTLRAALKSRICIMRPLGHEALLVLQVLFFGNLRQDLTEFVLEDLGVVRYETYPVLKEHRLFETRGALQHTLTLTELHYEAHHLIEEAGDIESAAQLAEAVLHGQKRPGERGHGGWHPMTKRRRDRLLNLVARALERVGQSQRALPLYEGSASPPARERRARILAAADRTSEALKLLEEIQQTPWDETELVFAPSFSARLQKLPRKRPKRPTRTLTLEPPKDERSRRKGGVERRTLDHLREQGFEGFFAENGLWRNLFGLLFWDIIFAPLPGVFQHRFQRGPLDLMTPQFKAKRESALASRLDWIRAQSPQQLQAEALGVHDRKLGVACHLVAWGDPGRAALQTALDRVPGPALAKVFERLSLDLARYGRGLPDLFVFPKDKEGFELLEVKGPGDQLRPEQGRWIDYLNANGLPTTIVKVDWPRKS